MRNSPPSSQSKEAWVCTLPGGSDGNKSSTSHSPTRKPSLASAGVTAVVIGISSPHSAERELASQQLLQTLHRVVDAPLHAGLNHAVTIRDRLEDGVRP